MFKLSWLNWLNWITFPMRSFKDENIQSKQVYNSDRLSYLTSKRCFVYVIILTCKTEFFWFTVTSLTSVLLKHGIEKRLLSNINDNGDNNEKTKHLKNLVGNL